MTLTEAPALYLAFASLHVLLGHLGSALVYRLRFQASPLVLYRAARSPHRRITRLVSLASLAWAAALVASATSSAFRALPFARPLFTCPLVVSWSLAVTGLALMIASQISMGIAFRVGQDEREAPPELRRRGPHALCRNPIYLGSWTFLLGMTLWHPSAILLALSAAVGLGIHGLVLAEERFLHARFGAAFEAYRRATPRYLPGPFRDRSR